MENTVKIIPKPLSVWQCRTLGCNVKTRVESMAHSYHALVAIGTWTRWFVPRFGGALRLRYHQQSLTKPY